MKYNNITPINVSWMITNRCNYNFQFCFRPTGKELILSQAKLIIDKLADSGLKKISWAGGEPLLWSNIIDLIEYTHLKKIVTMLITNGSLITDKILDRLQPCLDWLNLPLEGTTNEMNERMTRRSGHYSKVMDILKKLKNSNISLKINTVVSRINADDIYNMLDIIKAYNIKRWKLFQFYPVRGISTVSKEKFEISDMEFKRIRENITKLINGSNCDIIFENNNELENSYFSITPDGEAYTSINGRDYFFGNLLNQSITEIWNNNLLDKKKYWARANWVFNNSE